MKIDGPLLLKVQQDKTLQKRTLEIKFKEEFKALSLQHRRQEFTRHIQTLYQAAQSLDEAELERQGVQLMMQLCEELLPFILQDELDLHETLKLEMV